MAPLHEGKKRGWEQRLDQSLGGAVVAAFRLAERSTLARDLLLRPGVGLFITSAVRAWRRGGTAAWERFHLPAVRAAGRGRAAYLLRTLRISPESAASLATIHGYEDPLLDIDGRDEEASRDRAVRIETRCPLGERLQREGCADFCRVLVHAFETETLTAMNPRYRLEPLETLLSAGDHQCRFVHHVQR